MKRYSLQALMAAIVIAGASPVLAADLPAQTGVAPVPAVTPFQTYDWSGLYAGVNLGWAFGEFDNRGGTTGSFNTYDNSVLGGIYGGYNLQLTPSIVVGAEADLSLTSLDESDTRGGLRVNSSSDWNANIRGRIGYSFDQFLIYGAGGLALADHEVTANGDTDDELALGWTAGVGAEAALTPNVTARLEYLYQDFGENDYNLGGTGVSSELTNSQVRFGIGYKF